jgi:hypothetical protein
MSPTSKSRESIATAIIGPLCSKSGVSDTKETANTPLMNTIPMRLKAPPAKTTHGLLSQTTRPKTRATTARNGNADEQPYYHSLTHTLLAYWRKL